MAKDGETLNLKHAVKRHEEEIAHLQKQIAPPGRGD